MVSTDQNLREMCVNVNSRFTNFGNREISECQFSLIFVNLSEKLENDCVISCEIAKITRVGREKDFKI